MKVELSHFRSDEKCCIMALPSHPETKFYFLLCNVMKKTGAGGYRRFCGAQMMSAKPKPFKNISNGDKCSNIFYILHIPSEFDV